MQRSLIATCGTYTLKEIEEIPAVFVGDLVSIELGARSHGELTGTEAVELELAGYLARRSPNNSILC